MAEATFERVGRALALLRDGLAPYVSEAFHKAVEKGEVSMATLRRFAEDPMLTDRKVEEWDVAALTRAMRENWNAVFASRLERRTRTLLHEVTDIRNAWAHQQHFDQADTDRALDTIQRILSAIGADQAGAVRRLKEMEQSKQLPTPNDRATNSCPSVPERPTTGAKQSHSVADFERYIRESLTEAVREGHSHLELNAGQLHRQLGGYPGKSHQMTSCCAAMHRVKKAGDLIIRQPPSGKGASLTIRYQLPR
ncbi:MAG: Swt1 family HEPN domain-containing protein [Croceibacterium sp.]